MPDYTLSQVVAKENRRRGVYLNTTDATVSTLAQFATGSNRVYAVIAKIVANTTDYTTGQAFYVRTALFKNIAGTLTLVGSVSATTTIETDAAWDCTLDASGTNIRVRVTGAAATNIVWHAQVEPIEGMDYAPAFGVY